MVYVLSKSRQPLMPTERHGWVRRSLKSGKAVVVKRLPFTIQLTYDCPEKTQALNLGQDLGFNTVGVSVTSKGKEVFSAEYHLRKDVSAKVTERRSYRRTRRGKNTRYRAARFDNRKRKVLQPSIKQKVESHEQIIRNVSKILPITKVVVEANNFDVAKISNPDIKGKEYQDGDQKGFYNVKQYVLARDSYTCQAEKKGCSEKLHVHHIVFKSKGGSDAPKNLITLCEKHHSDLHKGKLVLDVKTHKTLKTATMMNVVRSQLLRRNPSFGETFGYETKYEREVLGLEKSHVNDAFVISGGREQIRTIPFVFHQKRRNNRCLQVNRKGFAVSVRKKRYKIQPKDIIEWSGKRYLVGGVQNKGAYLLFFGGDGKKIVKPTSQIQVIFHQSGFYGDLISPTKPTASR